MSTPSELCSPIVDLRQYTLYPGTVDAFIEHFDRNLVESQEACGMRVIGQFRDLGDPNRFVWMRGYPDMPSREKALTAFYMHSAAWKQHGEAARTKMIDSSDAMLLHPARSDSAFTLPAASLRPALESARPEAIVIATLHLLRAPADERFLSFYEKSVAPLLVAAGATMLGRFVTEHSPNNFPGLPLREAENVFASFTAFRNLSAYHDHLTAIGRHPAWDAEVHPALIAHLQGRPQVLRLAPTSRSQLR